MAANNVSSLAGLQPELLLEIIGYLKGTPEGLQDLRQWSSTSSNFRSLLTPYLFTSITLRNTEESGASIDAISKGKYREYVETLIFAASAPGSEEDGLDEIDGILPENVESILADLSVFPNLKEVRVGFTIDSDEGWDSFQDEEQAHEIEEAEQQQAWRALNTKMYAALAKNVNPGFKHLRLDNFVLVGASSFKSPEFQRLLGHLTQFSIYCWIDESGHYHANRQAGYAVFASELDEVFFKYLSSVKEISVGAYDMGVNIYGFPQPESQLDGLCMPLLENLSLEATYIDGSLEALLVSHAQTLKSVHLEDCYSMGSEGSFDTLITWEQLFNSLGREKPRKLRKFVITFDEEPALVDEYNSTQEGEDEAAAILEHLKAHPERRLFSYCCIDDKYGNRIDMWEANLESFKRGRDQRAYDELMQLVKLNAAKSSEQ